MAKKGNVENNQIALDFGATPKMGAAFNAASANARDLFAPSPNPGSKGGLNVAQHTVVQGPGIYRDNLNPPTPAVVETTANLRREYVSVRLDALMSTLRSLPHAFDDLTTEFGPTVYARMMTDAEVAASVGVLVLAVAAAEPRVVSAVDATSSESSMADEIAKFCQRCLDGMAVPFHEVQEEMLDALWEGSSVGEIVLRYEEDGIDAGRVVIDRIKKKPLVNTLFVVDPYNNVTGLINALRIGMTIPYGQFMPLRSGDVNSVPGLLPRIHFMLLTWGPVSGDPRGRSILRPAYAAWWFKQQALKLWMEWMSKYAQPSIWATTPEGALPYCDPVTGEVIEATAKLAAEGANFQNSTFAAFPAGTDLHLIEINSQGNAFDNAINWANREITRAILNQHLATGESAHMSRAAAQTHQDTLGLKVVQIKNKLAERWRRDVFRTLVALNFGRQYVHLTPKLDLGEGDGFPTPLADIAALLRSGWKPDEQQWAQLEKRYNLPVRQYIDRAMKRIGVEAGDGAEDGGLSMSDSTDTGIGAAAKPARSSRDSADSDADGSANVEDGNVEGGNGNA